MYVGKLFALPSSNAFLAMIATKTARGASQIKKPLEENEEEQYENYFKKIFLLKMWHCMNI